MWSAGSSKFGNEIENSQTYKGLNIFDTLEPEKVETYDKNNVATALLVDIHDSNNHTDPQLLGSFLDVKKKEFNLVDLLENLYVTPQHVINKNESSVEFDLFDNVDRKIDSQTSANSNIEVTPSRSVVRSFDEILDSAVSSRYPKLEFVKSDLEFQSKDSIDAQLTEIKTFETTIDKPIKDVYEEPIKILKPPNLITEPREVKNAQPTYKAPKLTPEEDTFSYCHIFSNISQIHFQTIRENEDKATCVNVFQPDSVTRYRKDIESPLIDLNKPPIVLRTNTVPIPILQTVKKDTKAFNKRRIVKKDCEKVGFTKGPDIYEKSIVLPQIIQRLGERKKTLDARKNIRRKLVLDKCNLNQADMDKKFAIDNSKTLNKNDNNIPKLTPEVLMEDCNKERLKALKLRTAFENFVISGQLNKI